MANDHSNERSKLSGASSTSVLIALLLAAGLIAAVIVWLAPSRDSRAIDARLPTEERVSTPPVIHDTPLAELPSGQAPREPTPTNGTPPALGLDRFDGRGRIRGEMLVAENVTFPSSWTLVIEPHPNLIGSENAVTKRIEFGAGEREFDVPDLPLGGYRIRAETPALNCTPEAALLQKGSEVVFATLRFRPTGFIEGRVLAHDGVPAEGVDVVLEALETKLRRSSKTDANGRYEFKELLDGDYKLFFGSPETPLVPPGDIQFQAPSLRFKDCTLPPTGAMVIETRAENGTPLAHVDVSGFGSLGGAVRTRTDFQGRARVAWLPPGDFRIDGETEDGRRGRIKITVDAGADTPAIMHLR